jgi:hypothetical protein
MRQGTNKLRSERNYYNFKGHVWRYLPGGCNFTLFCLVELSDEAQLKVGTLEVQESSISL